MPVPSPRNSIRIARGNYADLNANVTAFGEGEFIYAIDQDRFYTAASGVLVAVGAGVVAAEGIDTLADVDTSTIAPGVGQVLKWDGTNWVPADDSNTDAVTSVAGKTGAVTLVKADITDFSDGDYATAAQGSLADGAVQSAGDTMTGALGMPVGSAASPSVYFDANTGIYSPGADKVAVSTGGVTTFSAGIDGNSEGLVAINTTQSTNYPLEIEANSSANAIKIRGRASDNYSQISLSNNAGTFSYASIVAPAASGFIVYAPSERFRLDSSGRLLVGTSSSRSNFNNSSGNDPLVQVERAGGVGSLLSVVRNNNDAFGPVIEIGKTRGTAAGSYTLVSDGDNLGRIYFNGSDGSDMVPGAAVEAYVDGTPGANDLPSRLVFSTTADSASSPTERMAIDSTGLITTTGSFKDPAITGTILEDIYTITDGAAFEVDPGNGSLQLITLGANRTPKATNFAAGEAVTLMIDDGSAYTLTWTDTTWGTSGVVWTGGSAPALATTGYTVVQFWKVGTQVYGAYVGDAA